jgi:hypothetical protein
MSDPKLYAATRRKRIRVDVTLHGDTLAHLKQLVELTGVSMDDVVNVLLALAIHDKKWK